MSDNIACTQWAQCIIWCMSWVFTLICFGAFFPLYYAPQNFLSFLLDVQDVFLRHEEVVVFRRALLAVLLYCLNSTFI